MERCGLDISQWMGHAYLWPRCLVYGRGYEESPVSPDSTGIPRDGAGLYSGVRGVTAKNSEGNPPKHHHRMKKKPSGAHIYYKFFEFGISTG